MPIPSPRLSRVRVHVCKEPCSHCLCIYVDGHAVMTGLPRRELMRLGATIRRALRHAGVE